MTSKLEELISKREGYGVKGAIPTTHNNPGDLRHSPHSTHPAGEPNSIGQIDNPADGWADLERQLGLYAERGLTIQQLAYIYAPPADGNDTAGYIKFLCTGLGCSASTPVSEALKIPGGVMEEKTQWQKSAPIVASAGTGTMLATLVIAALTHFAQLDMSPDVKSAITGLCIAGVSHFFHGSISA